MDWKAVEIEPKEYKCGYCDREIAPKLGFAGIGRISANYYGRHEAYDGVKGRIYICHNCSNPTYFDLDDEQYPGVSPGSIVKYIDNEDVEKLYLEARMAISSNCYTSTVMCCRKLLMNISVAEGADEGLSFANYVNFLKDKNYIPPKGLEWADEIRKIGNQANHKIEIKTKEEATRILIFTEMLLRFLYELPNMLDG